jgi:molybdate transport system substrate-binding protein
MPGTAALLLACALVAHDGQAQPITVSAAVSLTEVLNDLGRAFERSTGGRVVFNFAASNVLSRQIVNGAPVDVFVSADEAQMALVEKAGMISPGTLVRVAGSQLALIVRSDWHDLPASIVALRASSIRRIAIGDPNGVPAGVYARQYLERAGLWTSLHHKIIPVGSVRAVLAAVSNGAADAGIVYVTDAATSDAVRVVAVITGPQAPQIAYLACAIASSRRADAARAFVTFLQTAHASRIFERHGFQPLAAAR